jgi:Fe-S-cluster containining protein
MGVGECTPGCGACCEDIVIPYTKTAMREALAAGVVTDDKSRRDREFILEHWHRVGGGGTATHWACDRFDTATRLCTAHDDRPPVCSGFPWYSSQPGGERIDHLPRACTYVTRTPVRLRQRVQA